MDGIGGTLADGTPGSINNWDMGVVDVAANLSPINSVIQSTTGTDGGTNTTVTDTPGLAAPYDVSVNVLTSRTNPAFRQSVIVAQILPPSLMGDYHLTGATSAAWGRGAASTTVSWGGAAGGWSYGVSAPGTDIDGQVRPSAATVRYDAGSDQVTP